MELSRNRDCNDIIFEQLEIKDLVEIRMVCKNLLTPINTIISKKLFTLVVEKYIEIKKQRESLIFLELSCKHMMLLSIIFYSKKYNSLCFVGFETLVGVKTRYF